MKDTISPYDDQIFSGLALLHQAFSPMVQPQGLLCITHYSAFCVLRDPQILMPNGATPPSPSTVTSRVDLHPIEAYQDFGAGSQERKCSDDCNVNKEPT